MSRSVLLSLCFIAFATGCNELKPTLHPDAFIGTGVLARVVTPNVALDTSGANQSFVRDENLQRRDIGQELDAASATRLASLWLVHFAKYQQALLELQAGAKLSIASIVPCLSSRYARSALLPDAASAADARSRYRRGSWWIVPFCDAGILRGFVAVAANAHRDALVQDISRGTPELVGNEFVWGGIDETRNRWVVRSPEAAAIFAASATGAKITRTPELITMYASGPYDPYWRITIDRQIPFRDSTGRDFLRDSIIFVGGHYEKKNGISVGSQLFVSEDIETSGGRRFAVRAQDKRQLPLPDGVRRDMTVPRALRGVLLGTAGQNVTF